jgi:hypothetical protein
MQKNEHGHDDQAAADAKQSGQHAGHGTHGQIQGEYFEPVMSP